MNCNLPRECDCELCKYWEENNCDVSRTPYWQLENKKDDEDE